MMQIFRWLFGSLTGLCLLAGNGWAVETTESPPAYHSFTDTSGQLELDDILSNRYANLFVPTAQGPLKLPGNGAALWVQIPLTGRSTQLLEAHRSTIANIQVYLLNDGVLRSSYADGTAQPQNNMLLPHGGFAFPINVNERVTQKLLVRLQNDYPVTTHLSLIPFNEASRIHNSYQALQGILIGLMFSLTLNGLLHGLIRKQPLLLLMAASTLLFGLSNMSCTGWSWYQWPFLQGQTSSLLSLAGFILLATLIQGLYPLPGTSGSRNERLAVLLSGTLVLLLTLVQPGLAQGALSIVRAGLPCLTVILIAATWIRRKPIDQLFLIGSLLLLASWIPGQFFDLPPHDFKRYLADFMLWGALLCFTISLHLRSRKDLLKKFNEQHDEQAFITQRTIRAEFLTRISHELRTPMNGVLGMSELLLDSSLSAKQRDYAQTIHDSGTELLTLINDILDLARMESGKLVMDTLRFDLHALINDCLNSYRNRLANQPIELISFIHPDVPRLMEGDPARLQQIIMSLLNNALLNTDAGEILLVVILEEQSSKPPLLRITIQDTGHGMSPEARRSLTERTVPAHRLLDIMESQGQLSLYIARELLHMMEGQLGIRNSQERGTSVWLTLPARLFDSPLDSSQQGQCLVDRSILIVDDSATCRTVLQQQTSAWQMNAQTASSGREALAMLRAQANLDNPFEILLIDQAMPGMTGIELASKIKGDPTLNDNLLIIMLTGANQLPSRGSARNVGIHRILSKPVSGYSLRAALIDEWTQFHNHAPAESVLPTIHTADFNVLVVEDNLVSTRVIESMLGKLDVDCDSVDNGEKAVARVKQGHYDLVLMDCEMPEMDGFTATEQIRAWEKQYAAQPVPIVALTAHILPEHRERARRVGMNGHMAKPVELEQLKALLEHWRESRSTARPHRASH